MSRHWRWLVGLLLAGFLLGGGAVMLRSGIYGLTLFILLPVILGGLGAWSVRAQAADIAVVALLQRELARKGEPLSINRMLEELGGIRETLVVYPRRQGQRQASTATCLTRMTALQQRLFSLLGLQQFVPATR